MSRKNDPLIRLQCAAMKQTKMRAGSSRIDGSGGLEMDEMRKNNPYMDTTNAWTMCVQHLQKQRTGGVLSPHVALNYALQIWSPPMHEKLPAVTINLVHLANLSTCYSQTAGFIVQIEPRVTAARITAASVSECCWLWTKKHFQTAAVTPSGGVLLVKHSAAEQQSLIKM